MTPDAVLPARDALLDATYMRGRLARLLMGTSSPTSLPVERVTVMRVKYRPGESLRVLYRLRLEGQGHLVSSRMRPGGLDALYAEAQQHEVPSASGEPGRESQPSASLRGVAIDRDLSAVFWTFPNDRCLRGTADWAALRAACAGPVNPATARFEVAGYAPERAVVFRVGDDDPGGPHVFAKVFAPRQSAAARQVLERLAVANAAVDHPVRVPRVLAHEGDILVTEALPGVHLHAMTDLELDRAMHALGTTLGRLQTLPAPAEMPLCHPFSHAAIEGAARVLAAARPDVADAARRLAERLNASRPHDPRSTWMHGDLNSRNWLLHAGTVALFDFDDAVRGPSGADVGGVLAWMHTRTLAGLWTAPRERELVLALLTGYRSALRMARAPVAADLMWYRSAALLVQRAVRAVTRVRRAALQDLDAMLASASRDLPSATAVSHA